MEKRNEDGFTETEFLANYHPGDYERPSVTVDMMILRMKEDFRGLQILLIQRKNHPFIENWALPGGFINMDESAYDAACRELQEETGLTNIYLEQVYTMSRPDRDPRMRVIDIAYAALLPYGGEHAVIAGDDAKNALWFDISLTENSLSFYNEEQDIYILYSLEMKTFQNGLITITNKIPRKEERKADNENYLAFDHADIILEGLMRFQNKVMYTDIAFNLVPAKFTLPDLQRVYEVLLGKSLYKANFRKLVQEKIIALNVTGKPIISQKPAMLYQYKEYLT